MKWAVALGATLLVGSLAATEGRAQAQDTTAAVRIDTSAQQEHMTVQRRGGPPASVQQARRRIARIGGRHGAVRRVIYPVVIVIPPPSVVYPEPERREEAVSPTPSPSPPPPIARERYPEYDEYEEPEVYEEPDVAPRYREEEERRAPIVRFRRERARPQGGEVPEDTTSAEAPADSLVPPSTPVAPEAEAPSVRRIERAILETGLFRAVGVNFGFDESTLLSSSRPTLDAVGEVLAQYPDLRVEVAGHTDAIGSDEYNQRLSEARAQSVRRYLLENFDLDPERITARGYGESQPIASNENATERTLNRRVEFRVLNPEAAERYLETGQEGAEEGDLRDVLRQIVREELQRMQAEGDTARQN